MGLKLSEVFPIEKLGEYKVHFAKWNQKDHPLDVFARDREEWKGWQQYRGARDDFNRPYIFSLARVYYEEAAWLFGGIYRVVARHEDWYEVELCEKGKAFIGRLKLKSGYGGRLVRVTMESVYEDFEVIEILKEEYQGRPFGGLEWVDVSFAEIEVLVRNGVGRWSGPLENVKGVYLITDTFTGKRYVGSAYGEGGVWGRWRQYAWTGHGGNAGMQPIVLDAGIEYCRANFRFALLESHPFRVSDDLILRREGFWKEALQTRGEGGMNRN